MSLLIEILVQITKSEIKNMWTTQRVKVQTVRFNQWLEHYLKQSFGKETYNLTEDDKIQVTETTEIKFPNIGSVLIQKWNIKCNNKNMDSKVGNFIKRNHNKQFYWLYRSNFSTTSR